MQMSMTCQPSPPIPGGHYTPRPMFGRGGLGGVNLRRLKFGIAKQALLATSNRVSLQNLDSIVSRQSDVIRLQ
ncbi:hypothetical protein AGOR_G00173240 [Albula goreensis]|uniref:Uncharacterized protein n=1 Tax=Albula goreensis TaxID=1534307 RepID=A0A8T3CYT8_9TELE|nr:hypothetical protein AGOR_G00173240 [Albula goreensis]